MATGSYGYHPSSGPRINDSDEEATIYQQHGRGYAVCHRGKYLFPVDEMEMDRMDATHKFFTVARRYKLCGAHIIDLDDLSTAVPDPQILDLGCGTGIWALDVAKRFWDDETLSFRRSRIEAVDKCMDMQPDNIYPNTTFTGLDFEDRWPGISRKHLIYARMLAGSVASWPQLYMQAWQHLIPGQGWFEQVEIDWDFANDNGPVSPHLRRWADMLLDAMDCTERPLRLDSARTIQALDYAGFVDIKEEVIHVRVNGGSRNNWEMDAGRWFNLILHKGFQGLSLAPLMQVKGWSPEQVSALGEEVLREIGDRDNTSYCRIYIWSARRPPLTPQQTYR